MSTGQSSGINVQDQGSHAYNENLNETRKMYNLFYRSFNFSKLPKDSGSAFMEFSWKFVYKRDTNKRCK